MLTQLTTVKDRLGLLPGYTVDDTMLTNAILAISGVFDQECNRHFARNPSATDEFPGNTTEIRLSTFPLEAVTKFELKSTEAEGWIEQTDIDFLSRRACVLTLAQPLGTCAQLGRVTYAGGYVLPGVTPDPGQVPLPAEIEQAAVDQVAYWYQNRDKLGLSRIWEYHATYRQFQIIDLLLQVRLVLQKYRRW